MTRIIGHRGAAGLALENTLESFRRALEVGVDIVEFDVHVTADDKFVICHDPNLKRVSGRWAPIRSLKYDELQKIVLKNGETVPLLETVLQMLRDSGKHAIVELKASRNLDAFSRIITSFGDTVNAVAATNLDTLSKLRRLNGTLKLYVVEKHNPFAAMHAAKMVRATGLDLNFWLLNPLTYWLARRAKLDLMVYTVNGNFLQRFISKLYPEVDICTNEPQKFIEGAPKIDVIPRRDP